MLRAGLCVAVLCQLALGSCKSKEQDKDDEKAQREEKAPAKAAAEKATPEVPPVEPDLPRIDATLEELADATLKGKLPELEGEMGIACGEDELLVSSLAHIGFDAAPLKTGKGFLFRDVCVGWRPIIKPKTEMYWMISAGAPKEGEQVMPVRRCVRISRQEDASLAKEAIVDGPCLSIHRLGQ